MENNLSQRYRTEVEKILERIVDGVRGEINSIDTNISKLNTKFEELTNKYNDLKAEITDIFQEKLKDQEKLIKETINTTIERKNEQIKRKLENYESEFNNIFKSLDETKNKIKLNSQLIKELKTEISNNYKELKTEITDNLQEKVNEQRKSIDNLIKENENIKEINRDKFNLMDMKLEKFKKFQFLVIGLSILNTVLFIVLLLKFFKLF